MIVQNLYHANLKIDAEGSVSLESAWELALEEPASGLEQLQAEARGWAGGIGEPFRIPAADGSYEFSETVLVTGIELKPVSLAVCRVIFSGDAAPGDMVRVRIDSVDDGELIGEQI